MCLMVCDLEMGSVQSPWSGCPCICGAGMGKGRELGSGNKDQTGGTKSDVWDSARKGRGGQDLSGGGGKTNQAEVDACAVLREGVGVRMHEGTTKREESAGWVCAGEAQSMAWVVSICAWEADACRARSKLLWFPNVHI